MLTSTLLEQIELERSAAATVALSHKKGCACSICYRATLPLKEWIRRVLYNLPEEAKDDN